jgi:hypothetical protein
MPRKQRYTAHKIYQLLQAEGYRGCESNVHTYVSQKRRARKHRPAYMPLEFDSGQDAQVDWGEAQAEINGARQTVQMFVMRLNYSKARFVVAFPRKRTACLFPPQKTGKVRDRIWDQKGEGGGKLRRSVVTGHQSCTATCPSMRNNGVSAAPISLYGCSSIRYPLRSLTPSTSAAWIVRQDASEPHLDVRSRKRNCVQRQPGVQSYCSAGRTGSAEVCPIIRRKFALSVWGSLP